MNNPNLTFNLLTFKHPAEEYTFYFNNEEKEESHRIYKSLVPTEVIEHFGEQDHYYTSFTHNRNNFLPVTKRCELNYRAVVNKYGEAEKVRIENSAFSFSILKRHYNSLVHSYFKSLGHYVKPNFISDTEVWIHSPKDSNETYNGFDRYSVKVQIARITKSPELLITYEGKSKVFKQSIAYLMTDVSTTCYKWVVYEDNLHRFQKLPDAAVQNYQDVFPVWNFDIRTALNQKPETPSRNNRYLVFDDKIKRFKDDFLTVPAFMELFPLKSKSFTIVPAFKINQVNETSNQLLFKNNTQNIIPFSGMKNGPFQPPAFKNIHFFFILHEDDNDMATQLHEYFKKGIHSFHGLYKFSSVPYHTESGFSIKFKDKTNPLPEIRHELTNRSFKPGTHYIAIYLSPYSKHDINKEHRSFYYKIKELLLKKDITSQAIESEKVRAALRPRARYDYSLNNIAIAILAKLNGIPWLLNTKLKNELIVGVGAFKNRDTNVQYIGSAFSFSNNGSFNRFEVFRKDQTDELAGSIINQIKEYVSLKSDISRLIIHFFKNMKQKELNPIEKGLRNLGLKIPVFIIAINKTESHDIVAFDHKWNGLMPKSGTFINIGFNQFLLFNNTRYGSNTFNPNDGYPFPIKLNVRCTHPELAKDHKTIKELIDQVYQFSRMYWKSVR